MKTDCFVKTHRVVVKATLRCKLSLKTACQGLCVKYLVTVMLCKSMAEWKKCVATIFILAGKKYIIYCLLYFKYLLAIYH